MKKLLVVLLLLSLLVTCIPLAYAADKALQTPTIQVITDLPDEGGVPVVYSGVPTRIRVTVLDEDGKDPWYDDQEYNLVVKYTIIRDSDGADVTKIPVRNAIERTTSYRRDVYVTDGAKMIPGTYTIKARVECTYKGYKNSPEATQKFIVSSTKAGKTGSITITNGDQSGEYPLFKVGEQIKASIVAPGSSTCKVYLKGKNYPITLADGKGTFVSDPITDGSWGYVYLSELDGVSGSYDSDEYYVDNGDLSITTDKKSYSIGDTATITLTCSGTDYFYVRLSFREKKDVRRKEGEKEALSAYYKATSGTATITIPLTEAGWLDIEATAYSAEDDWIAGTSDEYQIDNPENIRADSDDLVPPANMTILPNAIAGLDLAWSASANANGYTVYRADSENTIFEFVATTDTTSYTDAEAPVGKVVYYRVVSRKVTADGRYSTRGNLNDAPFKSYMLLAKPKLKVNVKKAKTLGMSWKKVKGADYYEVYYNTKSTAPTASTKATLTVKDGVKVDATKKVKAGKTYYCYVRAVKAFPDGTKVVGPWSKVVKKKAKK